MPQKEKTKVLIPFYTKERFMNRAQLIQQVKNKEQVWDMIVIGGGATGLGVAMDAASRGYKTLLLEQVDFAKGTSSRSTKLVHGGVRYLAQGDIALVREALYERGLLLKNAPHLVKNQSFIIPNYEWWGGAFYTIGLKIYDLMAGKLSLGKSFHISKKEVGERLSVIRREGLRGGVVYHDGQFDDARLAVNIAQTCVAQGGVVLNYCEVKNLTKNASGKINGVVMVDRETGEQYQLAAKVVVNATGIFVDGILQMDKPGSDNIVRPSQGVHLVLDASFLPGEDAIMIPKTEDGRVLFAVPWHNKVVVGTTDTPLDEHSLEPRALEEEIEFILRTAARYLTKVPTRKDALSVFAGLRPLAATQSSSGKTKEISRSHKLIVSASGLVTITGGKWTTFRRMGQDTVDKAAAIGGLPTKTCVTQGLPVHGYQQGVNRNDHLYVYGSDQPAIHALVAADAALGQRLHPRHEFIAAEVLWATRYEMARTVEDVLARRVRALFLDARAAIDMAPQVAAIMAKELQQDEAWQISQVTSFTQLANGYLLEPYHPHSR
jgi:glycerol-3-phosphate dehydrogenase